MNQIERKTIIPITIRPMVPSDRACILSHWIDGYFRGASSPFRWCSRSTFYVLYQPTVEALLRASFVRMAVAPEHEDLIVGFSVVQEDMVHWCWTKEGYREQGIQRDLLQDIIDAPMIYTHETLAWRRKVAHMVPRWKYRPEAVEEIVRKDKKVTA